MTLYNEAVLQLKHINCNQLYRFQGGNSFTFFDIKNNKFDFNSMDKYFYFSTSFSHHKYFSAKRLRQFINDIILSDSSYFLCNTQLQDIKSYNYIRNLVINSDKISGLYGIKLICDATYYDLIEENCCYSNRKISSSAVERVDQRTYGGGYGVTEDWFSLLNVLTIFSCYHRITRENILEFLANMRNNLDISSKDNANFLHYNGCYRVNSRVYDDYAKYDIMNCLESIIDTKSCLPTSRLCINPKETIREVIGEYQKTREKVLKLLDDKYSKHLSR